MSNDKEKAIGPIIENAKEAATGSLVGSDYMKEMETIVDEVALPLTPLNILDIFKGGVRKGEMQVLISGPTMLDKSYFNQLAHADIHAFAASSLSRNYKSIFELNFLMQKLEEGVTIVPDLERGTTLFTVDSFSEGTRLDLLTLGQKIGKCELSEDIMSDLLEIMRKNISKHYPCAKQDEFRLTEAPDHKSNNYYKRIVSVKPKPSSLLMKLIRKA